MRFLVANGGKGKVKVVPELNEIPRHVYLSVASLRRIGRVDVQTHATAALSPVD